MPPKAVAWTRGFIERRNLFKKSLAIAGSDSAAIREGEISPDVRVLAATQKSH